MWLKFARDTGEIFFFRKDLAIPPREKPAIFEEQRARSAAKLKENSCRKKAEKELAELTITLEVKAGEGDKLYGSVGPEEVCAALVQKGYEFDKKQVRMREHLKNLGTHHVDLEIYPQVKTRLTVELVRQP